MGRLIGTLEPQSNTDLTKMKRKGITYTHSVTDQSKQEIIELVTKMKIRVNIKTLRVISINISEEDSTTVKIQHTYVCILKKIKPHQ